MATIRRKGMEILHDLLKKILSCTQASNREWGREEKVAWISNTVSRAGYESIWISSILRHYI